MNRKLTIIKLGGSLLTDKSSPSTHRKDVLKSVVIEIKECLDSNLIESLIIVHGVGSFGHPPVLKYQLHKGYISNDQLIHLSETQQTVNNFRGIIAGEFIKMAVFVNSADDFTKQAKVANGASTLLQDIFGERGKHARCALGVNTLPLGAAVELDLIVAIRLSPLTTFV